MHCHAPLSSHVWLNETGAEKRSLPFLAIWCLTFLCHTSASSTVTFTKAVLSGTSFFQTDSDRRAMDAPVRLS